MYAIKLNKANFFPVITDKGVTELYDYCNSILYKAGRKIPPGDYDDIRQEMMLVCLSKLPEYDEELNDQLGGYLYWHCRGAITKWINKRRHEVPAVSPILEKFRGG